MANLSNINNKFIVTDEGNVLIGKTANSSGRLQIKDTQTSNFNDGLAITRNNAAQTGYINMVGGAFNFNSPGLSYKFRNNGTQTLELNSSGNATFTGNVGIGAAASDGNLHVRKTGINTGITNVLMNANFADGSNGTGLSIGYRTDETTAVLAARTATGNIAFYSYDGGWSESMRISNTGNVGIGTDSPSSTLDVRGSGEWYDAGIIVRRDAAPTQFGTISQYNGSLNLISVVGGGGGNGEIMFSNHNAATGTPTERMRIDSSGNVGIGTTNPGAQLELKKETTWGTLDNQVIYINNTGTGGNTGALHDMGSITWRSGNVNTAAISGIRNTPGSGNNVDLRFTTATQSGGQQTSMTILSGGNVGIGTTGPTAKLVVDSGSFAVQGISTPPTSGFGLEFWNNSATSYMGSYNRTTAVYRDLFFFANETIFQNAGTERMRITSAGNVGIGTTSPDSKITIQNDAATSQRVLNIYHNNVTANGYASIGAQYTRTNRYVESEIRFGSETLNGACSYLGFVTGCRNDGGNTEKMRITSGGYLNAGAYTSSSNTHHKIVTTRASSETFRVENNSTTPYGQIIRYGGATPNTTDNWFLVCEDQTLSRLIIWSNGNVVNRNNSYGSLSDAKLKENIVDATPKLNELMKVKVRNYNLIGDDKKQIGVIAQELEEVFPNMIDESIDFENKEVTDEEGNVSTEKVDLGTTTKSVKYSVFIPMLIKSIQELKADNDSLKARIETLENN